MNEVTERKEHEVQYIAVARVGCGQIVVGRFGGTERNGTAMQKPTTITSRRTGCDCRSRPTRSLS